MSAASAKPADPSMEDILASIRRIIADDQDPTQPAAGAAPRAAPAARIPSAPEPADDDVLDLAELPETRLDLPPHRDLPPLDLAPPDLAFAPEPLAEPAPAPPPPAVEPPPRIQAAPPRAPEPPPPPEPRTAPRAAPHQTLRDITEEAGAERLISDASGASVSQAFNALTSTVMAQNRLTIEDMVKDMLRPMLRDWLDENLPPLVERLVRAEIERVARGGR